MELEWKSTENEDVMAKPSMSGYFRLLRDGHKPVLVDKETGNTVANSYGEAVNQGYISDESKKGSNKQEQTLDKGITGFVNFWILQSNPITFDIIASYRKYRQSTWHSAFAGKVKKGDKGFCLKSKGKDGWRGVLSLEEVTCDAVQGLNLDPPKHEFWKDKQERERLLDKPGFRTKTIKAFPDNPIYEEELGKLGIYIRSPLREGVSPLIQHCGKALENLVKETRCVA